jgi:hypothetical protein
LDAALDTMAAHAQARVETARAARRSERLARLGEYAEALRGPLSALPDHALLALEALHAQGEALTPARRARMLADAARETPGIDPHVLAKAIDEAVARPRVQTAEETARLREQLTAAVPAEQRHLLADAAILVMDDAAFARFARSRKGDAVTLLIDGRPTVVMRRGADPHVLQEEGIHVLQAREPATARQAALLDERTLAEWDHLPVERQMEVYRAKMALEIDAQQRLLGSLEERARGATPEELAALGGQRKLAEESLANLRRREVEVRTVSALHEAEIGAGLAAHPEWLDQPARLFAKGKTPTLGEGFKQGDTDTATALGKQMRELLAKGLDAAAYRRAVDEMATALGDPGLAAEVVRRLSALKVEAANDQRTKAVNAITALARLGGNEGHAAIRFAIKNAPQASRRLADAAGLLRAIPVATLPEPALRSVADTLAELRKAGAVPKDWGDPLTARVLIEGLRLTSSDSIKEYYAGVGQLLRLRSHEAVGAPVVADMLRGLPADAGARPRRVPQALRQLGRPCGDLRRCKAGGTISRIRADRGIDRRVRRHR